MNPLVDFWRAMSLDEPPYIHPEDREVLNSEGLLDEYFDRATDTFEGFVDGNRFGNFDDNRFYAALFPAPYMGRLDAADIVILMLNPGFEYVDYYAEYRTFDVKKMREKNLRQELNDFKFPFSWLDPEYCWHSGFVYWEKKLRKVLTNIANKHYGGRYLSALEAMSRRLATLQLIPYHSSKFEAGMIVNELPSVREIKRYVKNILEPAACRGEKTLVVMRQRRAWDLQHLEPNIIVYESGFALGARLEPETSGGRAILNRFESARS